MPFAQSETKMIPLSLILIYNPASPLSQALPRLPMERRSSHKRTLIDNPKRNSMQNKGPKKQKKSQLLAQMPLYNLQEDPVTTPLTPARS